MGNYSATDLQRLGRRIIEDGDVSMHGFDATPFAEAMLEQSKTQDGGIFFEDEIASNPTTRTRWFVDGLGVNGTYTPSMNDRPDNSRMARWEWYNNYCPLVLNKIEAQKYGTETQLHDYVKTRMKLATEDHVQEYARSFIHADGTNNDFQGILSTISETGSETYAGLGRKFFPAFIGNVGDATDVAASTNNIASSNNMTVTKGSNVALISGDVTTNTVVGRDAACSASGMPNELRTIVARDYNTTNTGFTTIWFNRPFNKSGSYDTVTVQSKFTSTADYGNSGVLTAAKLRRIMQRCNGKTDQMLSSSDTWGAFMGLVDAHTYAVTQEERKTLGIKGFHKAINFDGALHFIDDHMPSGEIVGTKFSSWKFRFLDGFEFSDFEHDDKVIPLVVGGGAIGLGLCGYVMINVCKFGTNRINEMFKLTNVTL